MTAGSRTLDALDQLIAKASEASATALVHDAQALRDRVREGRFFVACVGQFKRGKSSLINALLGEELLPSGVIPVTSVVTVVRHGERRARVCIRAGGWQDIPVERIGEYVSERDNPENRKGVRALEVFCPSSFLERGLCLVDTPGIGSIFTGNTAEGSARDWDAFLRHLETLARHAGDELVELAADRGVKNLVARLQHQLDEERAALLRPVAESKRRLVELKRCAADAEKALVELSFLFEAEQAKLAQRFAVERQRFLARALPSLTRELDQRVAGASLRRGPQLRRFVLEQSHALAESAVRAWLPEQTALAAREFVAVSERFVELANGFLERLRASGQLPSGAAPLALTAAVGLRAPSRYYFSSFMAPSERGSSWTARWLDVFRDERAALAAAAEAGRANATWLLNLNAERVESDVTERILESRRAVQDSVRRALEDIEATAARAIEHAEAVRARGEHAVRDALTCVERRLTELDALAACVGTATVRSRRKGA